LFACEQGFFEGFKAGMLIKNFDNMPEEKATKHFSAADNYLVKSDESLEA
jgi:hypothetical protein